jgi:hypothetical protein
MMRLKSGKGKLIIKKLEEGKIKKPNFVLKFDFDVFQSVGQNQMVK